MAPLHRVCPKGVMVVQVDAYPVASGPVETYAIQVVRDPLLVEQKGNVLNVQDLVESNAKDRVILNVTVHVNRIVPETVKVDAWEYALMDVMAVVQLHV